MKELKCPRCKNEELQGNENYCPICGLDLKEKTVKEESFNDQGLGISSISRDLKCSKCIKRTAQEKTVQEQLISKVGNSTVIMTKECIFISVRQ